MLDKHLESHKKCRRNSAKVCFSYLSHPVTLFVPSCAFCSCSDRIAFSLRYHGWSDLLVNEMVPAEALQLDTEDLPDPASNLGSRRWLLDFAVRKKRPQVRFMTKLFKNLVQEAHLVGLKITEVHDVGGGRGDLALAVSSALPRLQVHVWESFGPSVAHGRARAKDLDLNLRFLESSATDPWMAPDRFVRVLQSVFLVFSKVRTLSITTRHSQKILK